jgi:hypothetical protein
MAFDVTFDPASAPGIGESPTLARTIAFNAAAALAVGNDFFAGQGQFLLPDVASDPAVANDFSLAVGDYELVLGPAASPAVAWAPTFHFVPTEDTPTEEAGGRRLLNASDRLVVVGLAWNPQARQYRVTAERLRPARTFSIVRDT